jgi:putative ABC transport system substrate-binding protein
MPYSRAERRIRRDLKSQSMSLRLGQFGLVLILTSSIAALVPPRLGAAESAQKVVRLGFVAPESFSTPEFGVAGFWQRLRELGWIEGQNMVVERRWADGHIDRLPALMADAIGRKVDVLVTYGTPAGLAAKKATSTTPIVATLLGDPVGFGLAESLARPGGNLTGLSVQANEDLSGKWLELLQETVPRLSTIAVIGNPDSAWVRKINAGLGGRRILVA